VIPSPAWIPFPWLISNAVKLGWARPAFIRHEPPPGLDTECRRQSYRPPFFLWAPRSVSVVSRDKPPACGGLVVTSRLLHALSLHSCISLFFSAGPFFCRSEQTSFPPLSVTLPPCQFVCSQGAPSPTTKLFEPMPSRKFRSQCQLLPGDDGPQSALPDPWPTPKFF